METRHHEQVTRRDVRGVPLDERVDLAYRLARVVREEVEMLPQYAQATVEGIDAAVVHALRMAINVAEGREPWEARPHGKSPGPPPRDWMALTGHSLEELIFLVRLRRIEIVKMKRENPDAVLPHSGGLEVTCDEILKNLLILKPKPGAAFTEFAGPLARIIKVRDGLLRGEDEYSEWTDGTELPLTFEIAGMTVEQTGWIGRKPEKTE